MNVYNLLGWPLWQPSPGAEDAHHEPDLHKTNKASWQPRTFPAQNRVNFKSEVIPERSTFT